MRFSLSAISEPPPAASSAALQTTTSSQPSGTKHNRKPMRSISWLLLALAVFVAAQQAGAQAPGTIVTGPFVWDGQYWHPVEQPAPPAPPAPPVDEVAVYADAPPPPLPVYVQPPCPQPNLIWTPGNWQFGPLGFFWVPGAWVPAPYVGGLWTPPYWGWVGGRYGFHAGYWGPHVGFYGGVNYGGGFMGIGFAGGSWNGGVFAYNTAVVQVNRTVITNVYVNRTIVDQTTIINNNHVAFNGGPNGVQHQPTPEEQTAMHEVHQPPTSFQHQHSETAKSNPASLAKNNGGHPAVLAEPKPLQQERHAPPAGFKPPPQRPVEELAKVQAPPSAVAAARTATTKTAAVAQVKPEAKPAAEPAAKPMAKPATEPAPKMEAKPAAKPTTEPAPKPVAEPPAKPMPKPEAKPATEPAPKPAAKPETKPAPKPAAKPETKPKPKPEEKKPE